jgi:hypothetical protein
MNCFGFGLVSPGMKGEPVKLTPNRFCIEDGFTTIAPGSPRAAAIENGAAFSAPYPP